MNAGCIRDECSEVIGCSLRFDLATVMKIPLVSSQRFAVSVMLSRCVTQWELAVIGWLVSSRTPMVGRLQPKARWVQTSLRSGDLVVLKQLPFR
jgi:hypothetical protein